MKSRAQRSFSLDEDKMLLRMLSEECTTEAIAEALDRPTESVRGRLRTLKSHGLELPKPPTQIQKRVADLRVFVRDLDAEKGR